MKRGLIEIAVWAGLVAAAHAAVLHVVEHGSGFGLTSVIIIVDLTSRVAKKISCFSHNV